MKLCKQIFLTAILASIGFVDARVAQPGAARPADQPQPTPPRVTPVPVVRQQPRIMQPKSYAEALDIIKTKMSPHQVLINNSFTQEFINFVKSLNLSDIETKALLQAGANIHTVWTDNNDTNKQILLSLRNNIQSITQIRPTEPIRRKERIPTPPVAPPKPVIQPKPMVPPKPAVQPQPIKKIEPVVEQPLPMKEHFIANNLVMTLDPEKAETVQNLASGAMVSQAIATLYEKAAPLIMTSNVLEIILRIKNVVGDINLQRLRMLGAGQKMQQAQFFLQAQNLRTISSIAVILLSDIDFDSKNLSCYFHKSEKLVLFIPKEYIRSNLPKAINFNLDDQAKVCGFNPAVLIPIANVTPDNLMKQLQIQQSIPIDKEKFIPNLTAMFMIQKKAGELIHPEQDTQWIIYLTGHGGPAYQTIGDVRKQLNMIKPSVVNARKALGMGQNIGAQQYIREYEPVVKKYEKMLEGRSSWADSQLVPESARVAGITAQEFSQLMKFFDKNLDVAYIHYMTCFAGGSNQTFVNEVLSSLDVDFIVSSEGIHEGFVVSQQGVQWDSRSNKLKLTSLSFAEFFRLLRLFFTQPEQFVKIKGKEKDPILVILRTINPGTLQESQPFVRFPAAGEFVAAAIDRKTEVLTQTIVRAHEIEKKPIDLRNKNVGTLIINTSRINVPLNLGKKTASGHTAIVFPSPKSFDPSYEAMYVLSEVNCEDTIQSFIFNCLYRNARFYTQTFVVKKLTGIMYQQSGLPSKQGSINNLIIQIKSVSGTNPGASNQPPIQLNPISSRDIKIGTAGSNIQVTFEFAGNIYQSMFAIKSFENPEELHRSMQQIKFTATPVLSTNMTTVANQFLTAQEVTKLAKPISLQSIAEFFDDKIDKQDPSMAIWSEADLEELQKFVEREPQTKQPRQPRKERPAQQQAKPRKPQPEKPQPKQQQRARQRQR